MIGLTAAEREHIEDLGADVVDWFEERTAVMILDGHVPEQQAYRLAYERACRAHGAKPVSAQLRMGAA